MQTWSKRHKNVKDVLTFGISHRFYLIVLHIYQAFPMVFLYECQEYQYILESSTKTTCGERDNVLKLYPTSQPLHKTKQRREAKKTDTRWIPIKTRVCKRCTRFSAAGNIRLKCFTGKDDNEGIKSQYKTWKQQSGSLGKLEVAPDYEISQYEKNLLIGF